MAAHSSSLRHTPENPVVQRRTRALPSAGAGASSLFRPGLVHPHNRDKSPSLCRQLLQTSFLQDRLGLPSNPTPPCSSRPTAPMDFPIFNLFSGRLLLYNHGLNAKIQCVSHLRQVALRDLREVSTHTPPPCGTMSCVPGGSESSGFQS